MAQTSQYSLPRALAVWMQKVISHVSTLNRILKGGAIEGMACIVFVYFVFGFGVYQRTVGFFVFQWTR